MKPSARLRTLHFTGIGGSGMSALASVMQDLGFSVQGSDRSEGSVQERLRARGIPVLRGHAAAHVAAGCDALVFTAAVDADNPELKAARQRGIPVVRRADLLGLVMNRRHGLAVAGTHGKSTTTGMLIHILKAAGVDPGWAVGAAWKGGESGHAGRGEYFAVEADEYDRAFLSLRAVSAIVTNVDADHLDYYGSLEAIEDAFVEFLNRLPFYGTAVLNAEDPGIRRIFDRLTCRVRTCGLMEGDYRARDVTSEPTGSHFVIWKGDEEIGAVHLKVFGLHNVTNALAAAALALEEGIPFPVIAEGLSGFPGMHRRLETVGSHRGVTILDDYAHHPAEVAAALLAARTVANAGGGRLVVVFQPHLYSRTQQFAADFAEALHVSDQLFVLPVYAARELPVPGVEGALIVEEAKKRGHGAAQFLGPETDPVGVLASSLRTGDVCITMGAGDVGTLAPAILEALAR